MKKILGIEFGSTRVKAVLLDDKGTLLSMGAYEWENQFIDGYWTYSLMDIHKALKSAYANLKKAYEEKYKEKLLSLDAVGISAMMHGYLAFDEKDELLVPYRTWRNANLEDAANELTQALNFNMPQRWSATHYYKAVMDNEPHITCVKFLTTLAGYVHWKLTGKKVLGIGDASGMFPIFANTYDAKRIAIYNELLQKRGIDIDLGSLLPNVVLAGEDAGILTKEGAEFLDETHELQAGAVFCAPEGDAGTGMVATNSVRSKTGNVSAGTSAFVMIVLERALKQVYKEIDVVTTPTGLPVAMVHVNNCTSEINAWVNLFDEMMKLFGVEKTKGEIYEKLFHIAEKSDESVGGIFACNFLSGEPIVKLQEGRPLIFREPNGVMTLANFMQAQIYSAVAALHIGMGILEEEKIAIEKIYGHGGYFKTDFVGQSAMSAALGVPITVMKNAGEGGAYGIGLLALYRLEKRKGESLEVFLDRQFEKEVSTTVSASEMEQERFEVFMKRYVKGLKAEREAIKE